MLTPTPAATHNTAAPAASGQRLIRSPIETPDSAANGGDRTRWRNAPEGTPDDERRRRTFALTALGKRVAVAEARRLDTLVADARRVLHEI